MRPLRVLSVYLVVVFLGGALLAPGLYYLVQGLSAVLPGLHHLASNPFPRFVNRSLLILALVGLIPFVRAADLRSWREIGLSRRPDGWAQFGAGFMLGFVTLATVVLVGLAAGGRLPNHEHGVWALFLHFTTSALTAGVVAVLEEIVFRGALFGILRKPFHWTVALVLSSAVYALVHFLERPDWTGPVHWGSGLVVLGGMLAGFSEIGKLIPGFLNLLVAGMILALAYQRTRTLHFSIGLHAGWIFWVKTYGFITVEAPHQPLWFYGTGKLIDGWLAFLLLSACFVVLTRFLIQSDPTIGWKERRMFS